jgi:hypothetical protein
LLAAYRTALDRLRIYYPSTTGLRRAPELDAQALAQRLIDPLEGSVYTPFPKVVVDGGPTREVVGKHAPLAAASQEIEDGVKDLA